MTKYQGPLGMSKVSYGRFGQDQWSCKYQGLFSMDQRFYGPCVLWTKSLMGILDRTKYQGPLDMDQMSYGHFGQDQMSANHKGYLRLPYQGNSHSLDDAEMIGNFIKFLCLGWGWESHEKGQK